MLSHREKLCTKQMVKHIWTFELLNICTLARKMTPFRQSVIYGLGLWLAEIRFRSNVFLSKCSRSLPGSLIFFGIMKTWLNA